MHQVLDISNNDIASLPASPSFPHLRDFNASHNRLSLVPEAYALLGALQELNLAFNKLTGLPSAFGQSHTYLQVCTMVIMGFGSVRFGSFLFIFYRLQQYYFYRFYFL
jgi:hypothetical protein